jgi:hypothetical protein
MAAMITDGANNSSDGSLSPPPYYTEAESANRGTEDAYMGPEGVTNYLQERGLAIDPDLSYAELTMKPGTLFGSVPSLFDEIRQHRKIRVNVEKLRGGENSSFKIKRPTTDPVFRAVVSNGVFGGRSRNPGLENR